MVIFHVIEHISTTFICSNSVSCIQCSLVLLRFVYSKNNSIRGTFFMDFIFQSPLFLVIDLFLNSLSYHFLVVFHRNNKRPILLGILII